MKKKEEASTPATSPAKSTPSIGRIVHFNREGVTLPAIVIGSGPGVANAKGTGPATVDLVLFGTGAKAETIVRNVTEGTEPGTFAWPARV